jgi:hypothetical protein
MVRRAVEKLLGRVRIPSPALVLDLSAMGLRSTTPAPLEELDGNLPHVEAIG